MGAIPRVAFFGGSFDPPHLGHLAVARAARAALKLDHILFAPVGSQPLKPDGASASFEDRVTMTRLAIAEEQGFEVSLLDAPHQDGAPNYTLDTLHALRGQYPEAELFLLLGADSFAQLREWHSAAQIPFAAQLIVASRPGQSLDNLAELLPAGVWLDCPPAESDAAPEMQDCTLRNEAGDRAIFHLLRGLHVDISATGIRALIRTKKGTQPTPLRPAVAQYIRQHQLYR